VRLLITATVLACVLLLQAVPVRAEPPTGSPAAAGTLSRALETRAYTESRFLYLGGSADCLSAPFVSYAHSEDYPWLSDEWYNASQIRADMALAPPDDPLARCWVLRGFTFLDRLWDQADPSGGFFPRSDISGERVTREDKYADDNSLTGIAWMEAAERAPNRLEREMFLGRARATAAYLMYGGLWDETFGGGFWWNSRRGAVSEGKPAQTNGLAAEFFLRLYALTGEPLYRAWGLRVLDWLDSRLWDPHAELYRWSVHHTDLATQTGEVVAHRFFNYDQGILIEANLLAYRHLGREQRYLERAQVLGHRLHAAFADPARGGYNLEAGVPQVYTVYSAWLTPSLLALYELDRDPHWLHRATANVESLNAALWDPEHGGYFQRHYACRNPAAYGCEWGESWAIGPEKSVLDQAWMQRAQALLARALDLPPE
jgi:hypothetical protein